MNLGKSYLLGFQKIWINYKYYIAYRLVLTKLKDKEALQELRQ